jgi:hypothetical protein
MLQQLIRRLFERPSYPMQLSELSKKKAFDVLSKHGIDAHYYVAAAGCADAELADALRLLSTSGFIMTIANGSVVGKVAKATLTADERAREMRKQFFLVEK